MGTIELGGFTGFILLNANPPEEDLIFGLATPRADSS